MKAAGGPVSPALLFYGRVLVAIRIPAHDRRRWMGGGSTAARRPRAPGRRRAVRGFAGIFGTRFLSRGSESWAEGWTTRTGSRLGAALTTAVGLYSRLPERLYRGIHQPYITPRGHGFYTAPASPIARRLNVSAMLLVHTGDMVLRCNEW